MKIIFKVKTVFEKKVSLTEERLNHILFKHPELIGKTEKIRDTLISPGVIRKSQYNSRIWLFYKFNRGMKKYLTVVVKLIDSQGFLVTAYVTDRIKLGEEIWKEK